MWNLQSPVCDPTFRLVIARSRVVIPTSYCQRLPFPMSLRWPRPSSRSRTLCRPALQSRQRPLPYSTRAVPSELVTVDLRLPRIVLQSVARREWRLVLTSCIASSATARKSRQTLKRPPDSTIAKHKGVREVHWDLTSAWQRNNSRRATPDKFSSTPACPHTDPSGQQRRTHPSRRYRTSCNP